MSSKMKTLTINGVQFTIVDETVGSLSDLNTTDKSSVVAAINEVASNAGNGSGGSSVTIDATLTQEGQAADAKAVGDAISKVSSQNVELDTTLTQSGKAADAAAVGDKFQEQDRLIEEVTNSLPEKLPNPQALIATGTTMGTITYDGANVAVINIPKALPNPNALIVTGTPEGDIVYNGSEGKVINIPAAGESAKDVTEAYTVSGLSNETDYLLTLTEPGEYLIQRTAENYRFRCQVENVNGALYHWIRTYGDDSIYGELLYIDGALVSDKEIDYTGVLYDVDVIDGVRYPRLGTGPQTLTEAQRENARNNIGAIPTPNSAAVGQTIVVKEVDEEGKPTEWEAADLPSGGEEVWVPLVDITLEEETKSIDTGVFPTPQKKIRVELNTLAANTNTNYMPVTIPTADDGNTTFHPIKFYPAPMPITTDARSFYEIECIGDETIVVGVYYSGNTEGFDKGIARMWVQAGS